MDYLLNGQVYNGGGGVASRLLKCGMNPLALRPLEGDDGRPYLMRNSGRRDQMKNPIYNAQLALNAPAVFRKDEWRLMDETVMKAAYVAPSIFSDIRSQGLTVNIPNAMGKTVYEYERQSDIGPATISMSPIREGDSDRPHYDLTGIPLPIIHKDFIIDVRQLEVSRNGNTPLDMTSADLATRKVIEESEKLTVGSSTYAFGGYNIYGFTNFPQRLTQTITAPSSSNHATTIAEVLSMRKKSIDAGFRGPWGLWVSPAWDLYLDEDYSTTKGENTLRDRILRIQGIQWCRTGYFLSGNTMLLVQLTSDVVQAVVGMDVIVVQWEEKGGFELHMKVMAILVPRLKADFNGKTGIVHGS